MKKIIIGCMLTVWGCTSIPKEEILNDPENIAKQAELHNVIKADINQKLNSENYHACVQKIDKLNAIANKSSFSQKDFDYLKEVFPTRCSKCNLEPSNIKDFTCKNSIKIDYDTPISEMETFCSNKYWEESSFATWTLFPVRFTNIVLNIGTLGLFSTVTGSCRSWQGAGDNWVENCIAPADSWNYSVCKTLLTDSDFEFEAKEFKQHDKLVSNIKMYCSKMHKNVKKYYDKECQNNDGKKGCLLNLNGYHVNSFGTRSNGIIMGGIFNSFFVYDNRDFYDGQLFQTDGYYYEYVGNYRDGIRNLMAFKRSKYKIPVYDEKCIEFLDDESRTEAYVSSFVDSTGIIMTIDRL